MGSTYRMLVVSGHYRREGDGVVIELFGRCDDGRSLTALYRGFDPYFYIVGPDNELKEELSEDPMVKSIEERDLWYKGDIKKTLKVTIMFPFDVPSYRKRYQRKGYEILAADIPFIYRFFYDHDLGVYVTIEGEEVQNDSYTTDIVVDALSIGTADPFKMRLKVLSFDIENSIKTGELYMVGITVGWLPTEEGEKPVIFHYAPGIDIENSDDREDRVIEALEKAVSEHDPDIITGYNIDGYDIPHMIRRCQHLSIQGLTLGRDGSVIESRGYRSWKIKGRISVDAWWQAKRTFHPKKESLQAVSELLLGEGKDDIDTSIIEDEWARRREDVIKYCERDSELALRILDRTQALKRGIALAYVAKLPVYDILSGTTSQLIDSILIRAADREGIGIPLTRHESKTSKIEGAYVHSIDPGIYHWLIVLDFRSMYPSLMIENNICFTTLTDQNEGAIRSPIDGVRYLRPEVKKGLVPGILKDLLEERQRAKGMMKGSSDLDEKEFYNGLQEALKVLMNSFYGVFASYFYRFTDRSIGSSITAFARENIKKVISDLESRGRPVIYSDTDSVFVQSPHTDIDGTLEFGKKMADEFSEGARILEFEKIFVSFFTHGKKKRYVGKVIWPDEEIVVRGYEMRRTDSFDLQSETLSRIFELVLDDDIDEALREARSVISRTRSGEVPLDKLVISRTVQEVEEDKIIQRYKNPDSMANVQALRKARKMGLEVVPGMKVSWIVVDGSSKPQTVEPYIDGRKFAGSPDHSYYSQRLASTLARVTEVFGVSEKELLTGIQQTSLLDAFPDTGENDAERDDASSDDRPLGSSGDNDDGKMTEGKDDTDKKEKTATLDQWM